VPCRACENLEGQTSKSEPHSEQTLIYRRKEMNQLRLYYLCTRCGSEMLTRRGPGATREAWSATVKQAALTVYAHARSAASFDARGGRSAHDNENGLGSLRGRAVNER
jgi:hypothetical protein